MSPQNRTGYYFRGHKIINSGKRGTRPQNYISCGTFLKRHINYRLFEDLNFNRRLRAEKRSVAGKVVFFCCKHSPTSQKKSTKKFSKKFW